MCNLSEAIEEKGIEQGLEQGYKALIELCQELNLSQADTTQRLVQKFDLTADAAASYVNLYWQ